MTAPIADISVVICAHTEGRWEQLVCAVESLECQCIAPHEILVVIDHNLSLAKRAYRRLPGVRATAAAPPRGAIIAFLDDDAIAAPDWVDRLLAGYANPYVQGVGGMIEPQWQEGRPRWFPPEFD